MADTNDKKEEGNSSPETLISPRNETWKRRISTSRGRRKSLEKIQIGVPPPSTTTNDEVQESSSLEDILNPHSATNPLISPRSTSNPLISPRSAANALSPRGANMSEWEKRLANQNEQKERRRRESISRRSQPLLDPDILNMVQQNQLPIAEDSAQTSNPTPESQKKSEQEEKDILEWQQRARSRRVNPAPAPITPQSGKKLSFTVEVPEWQQRRLQKKVSEPTLVVASLQKQEDKTDKPVPEWQQIALKSRREGQTITPQKQAQFEVPPLTEWQKRVVQKKSDTPATAGPKLNSSADSVWELSSSGSKLGKSLDNFHHHMKVTNVSKSLNQNETKNKSQNEEDNVTSPDSITSDVITVKLSEPIDKEAAKRERAEIIRKKIEEEEKMIKEVPKKKTSQFTKALWHEQYKATALIKEIFSRPDFTAEDLLAQGEALQTTLISATPKEVKQILNYFGSHEQLKKLIDYIGYTPQKQDNYTQDELNEIQKFTNYSTTSLQIVLQSRDLINKMMNSEELLSLIASQFMNANNFLVFGRLVQLLVFCFLINTQAMMGHLLKVQGLVDSITSKVGIAQSEDILTLLRLLIRAEKKIPGTLNSLAENNLIGSLVNCLSSDKPIITQEEATHILGEFLGEIKLGIDSSQNSPLNVLLKQFTNDKTIEAIFNHLKYSSSSLIYCLQLLTNALESEIEGDDSTIILLFIDNIDYFISKLSEKPDRSIKVSCGDLPVMGLDKIAILQFILSLATEEPEVISVLIESDFYSVAFDLIFLYPTNNVAHDTVLQLFLLLCTQDEDEVIHVFQKIKLLERISSTWAKIEASDQLQSKKSSINLPRALSGGYIIEKVNGKPVKQQCAYFGHLAILANMIVDLSEEWTSLVEMAESKEWKHFVSNGLPHFNMFKIKAVEAKVV